MKTCRCAVVLLSSVLFANYLQAQTWVQRLATPNPPQRVGHGMAYDDLHHEVVVFAGYGIPDEQGLTCCYGDTWTWNGVSWRQHFPKSSPGARDSLAMAFDEARGQVVLFGGYPKSGIDLGDTWVWDGTDWTQKFPLTVPPPRFATAMAYDSIRKRIVMFGGSGPGLRSDTWAWNGTNWTEIVTRHSPPPRYAHAMAFDAARGQMVVFGGFKDGDAIEVLNDTWVFDGQDWTQRFPATVPPARKLHALTYIPTSQQIMLFSGEIGVAKGYGGFLFANDTWLWDGSNWTEQNPPARPPVKDSVTLAYDFARNEAVAFGKLLSFTDSSSDTWVWTSSDQTAYSVSGGRSLENPNPSPVLQTGYAMIQPSAGSNTPTGFGILTLRRNNVVVSETSIPAAPLLQFGRIDAKATQTMNTGIAMTNPNEQPATVSFYFTDIYGNNFGSGTRTIAGKSQFSTFLSQPPFGNNRPLDGSFTFSSSVPISAVAIRSRINETGEFLMTTLPVAELRTLPAVNPIIFPQVADGGGWSTQISLVNVTDGECRGQIQFRAHDGTDIAVSINGVSASQFSYSIPPRTSRTLQSDGISRSTISGSAWLTPEAGSATPAGMALFSYSNGTTTVTEAGASSQTPATAFRLYAEISGDWGRPGSLQTGLAIVNSDDTPAMVNLALSDLDGSPTGFSGSISIAARGRAVAFLNEFANLMPGQASFKGVLRVSSGNRIAVAGLRSRYNERNDFLVSTTPSIDEAAPSAQPSFLPQVVVGAGYSTQIVVFSGFAGPASSGTVRLLNESGVTWNNGMR